MAEDENDVGVDVTEPKKNEKNMDGKDKASTKKKGFLDKLNEYKEFILILIFFSGGFVWIYGYFATKLQVEKLECLLNANIGLFANEAKVKFKSQELIDIRLEIATLLQDPSGSPDIKKQKELEADEQAIDRDLQEADKIARESSKLLLKNGCDNG